ncbi:MAG: hypothetical protein ACOC8B_03100, partial [Gemmatimonadota bacterium]
FSLGGNMLLKWLGESRDPLLDAAAAVSVPFRLDLGARRLEHGLSRLYQAHLLNGMKRSVARKRRRMAHPVDRGVLSRCRTFEQIDTYLTAPLHGFRDARDYYARSSCRQFLGSIRTPTLIIHALDDPFMTPAAVPGPDELSPAITMALSRSGGHCGFVGGATPLRPRYWLPTLRTGTSTGSFVGATTHGEDVVGRHTYDLAAAYAPENGRFELAGEYRWAGLGNPVLSIGGEQDWEHVALLSTERGQVPVHSRERRLELAARLLHRRLRSAAVLAAGGELIHERLVTDLEPDRPLERERLLGAFATAGFANYRRHEYSISREDGILARLRASRRWDRFITLDPDGRPIDRSHTEIRGDLTTYLDFPLVGFADHVIAARIAGLWRTGPRLRTFGIGGATGNAQEVLGTTIGGAGPYLPVRGFPEGHRRGSRAWTLNAEYRFPIALVGRGYRLWPAFLDRFSGAFFVDAGDAFCPADADVDPTQAGLCVDSTPLVGAGAEIGVDLSVGFAAPVRFRAGVAWPVSLDDDRRPTYYLRIGPSF